MSERQAQAYRKNKSAAYKKFGRFYNELWMTLQMHKTIFVALVILYILTLGTLLFQYVTLADFKISALYLVARAMEFLKLGTLRIYGEYSAMDILNIAEETAKTNALKMITCALISCAVFLLYIPILSYFMRKTSEDDDIWLDGGKIRNSDDTNELMKKKNDVGDIPLGEIILPRRLETYHVLSIGQLGVGKTVLHNQIISTVKKRGDRLLCHDFKGDYTAAFYNEADSLIFNPLDARHLQPYGGWCLFNEIRTKMDIDLVTASLISEGSGKEIFFNSAARDILSGILHFLYYNDMKTNRHIWKTVSLPPAEIALILSGTKNGGERGFAYLSNPTSPMALSVIAVMVQHVKCFEYMQDSSGDFCIGDWVQDESQRYKSIFVTNFADISETLRPILSLFFDIQTSRLLSLKEDLARRVFFILDEFPALQLSSVEALLTRGRSKGASAFLAIQSIMQLEKIYDKATMETIIDDCASSVIFRVGSPLTSDYLSKKIGDSKLVKTGENFVLKTSNTSEGVNLSKQETVERLVLPSTIQELDNLHCFVKMPGYYTTKTVLKPKKYREITEPFIMRSGLTLDEIITEQKRAMSTATVMKNNISAQLEREVEAAQGGIIPQELKVPSAPRQDFGAIDDSMGYTQ